MSSQLQTTLTPINGKEARELILIQIEKILKATGGLDMARSYHRLGIKLKFELSQYPSDIRTPARDIEFNIDSIPTSKGENNEHFRDIKKLETYREELIHVLEQVTKILDEANPILSAESDLQAGNQPDKLRIENGLPIPVVSKQGGRSVEVMKQVVPSKTGFQFAKKPGEK